MRMLVALKVKEEPNLIADAAEDSKEPDSRVTVSRLTDSSPETTMREETLLLLLPPQLLSHHHPQLCLM